MMKLTLGRPRFLKSMMKATCFSETPPMGSMVFQVYHMRKIAMVTIHPSFSLLHLMKFKYYGIFLM